MAARKSKARTSQTTGKKSLSASGKTPNAAPQEPGLVYVGQWNQLVSTTNWEKGRIICQWRDALEAERKPAAAYSDEAWAELVGGVTSQHVGRLRRVFQRFGETFEEYPGLYWSHFQAALDWDDAEMWLEGAIQSSWSVSQMRGKRWETLGKPGKPPAIDDAAAASGTWESADQRAPERAPSAAIAPLTAKSVAATAPTTDDGRDVAPAKKRQGHDTDAESEVAAPSKPSKRLAVDVDELPDDLADAFEQFKLAIIAHRRDGWRETTPDAVLECLDALRDLALVGVED